MSDLTTSTGIAIFNTSVVKKITLMRGTIFTSLGLAAFFAISCGKGPTPPAPKGDSLATATTQAVSPQTTNPITVNVYVENSGSMDGYVKGTTGFKQAVYSYLSDIKLSDLCDEMHLNYINSQVLKQPDDLSDFIDKLEPASFRMKGGNRTTTDISDIIGKIIKNQSSGEINILVSDFVFSPGKNKDAHEYLINQQIGIKGHLAKKLKNNPDFASIIFQLNSKFDGMYYNCYDHPTQINSPRPFYILLFGEAAKLHQLLDQVPKSKIKGSGVQNTYCISKSSTQPSYGILTMPRIGSFVMDPANPKAGIKNAKIDKKHSTTRFSISIGVDFSSLLLENDYICDTANYSVSNRAYSLSVAENKTAAKNYTHILTLALNQNVISKGSVKVSLNMTPSSWATAMTDEDGEDINADGAMDKTFGLKYLVDGLYDAYSSSKDNGYASIIINIQ